MARFLDSTSSIKKEAGKKKKKQETTQQKQTTQSPSYSQKVQQTNQRLTQKYGGGGSGGSARTTTSRTNPDQRTTQAQNQKMYGQPTQPVRRNQAELQRQKEERRSRAQEQKSGNFERPISRAQYADKRRATSFREKYTRWDNDIAETVGHTLRQTVAEDKRYLNRAAKGITMKDRHQWATPEQIRKADERTERRDRKYASQIEKEGQELEKLKQGHSYLGQQALSATSSATGMAADLAVGALTGTGEAGSLGHMFMRSTGGAYGQVKKKAASLRKQLEASGNYTPDELDEMFKDVNKRDELNAMASGGIEVLSELMFRGFGPAAKYVGKGGGIAERAAGKLFKKAGGRATSGIVKNALRGTAEEVAEEEIGGPLQALAANTIYGNKYQKYSEDAVKRDFKAQSDELRSQIHSDEDAQMVTARLNSDAFMNDSIKAYMDSGMSEDEARQMAEMSREYLTASLSGDIDKMSEMQNKLVDKLAGGENTLKEKFTLRDAVDAAVSTSMMTLTTGVPGAISTAQAGKAYKGTQGLEGVRNLAEVVRNWDTEESAKAQKIIDAIDNGSDVSDTQVYELIQKAGSAAEAQSEAETTKDQIAQKGMEKYDLRVAPAVRDEYGDVTLSENTQQRYDKIVNDTVSRYDSLAKLGESERFEKAHVKQGASLAAAQMTGVITAEDVHELVKADPEVKAVFQDVTGIALDQFTEYDKNGNIDVASTNNSMMNALMAEAATNYINSARLEQAAWANDVRGEMLQTMSDNLNSKGDEALFDALQNIDPRDRDTFMLTGMASQYVYEHGWSTQDTWEEAKGDLQRMFPSLSVDSLQGVYEAAKEDRIESETPFLNAQVVKDEALTELAKSGQKAEVRGKFKNRTKRVLNAEETVICASLAKQFNANITMVGEKNKNLSYIDENGEEKFSNAAVVLSKGEIYISKKADISKIIHEVTHMGAKLASTQYLDMAHYIMDKAYKHSPERTRMLVEAYKRTYQGQNLTDAQIEEEVVADIVTAFEHDRVFLREIAQEEPSLFRRIYNAICDVIRTLRNILSTGRVLDPELQETFLAEIGAYEETRRMWLDMMHEAARNNAIVGLAKWENNAYKDSRQSRTSIANKREAGEKLTNKEFGKIYNAHKLNLRGKNNLAEQIADIKENGFKGGSGAINVIPAINGTTAVDATYGPKAGDTILLVPDNYVKNDKVAQGFKPYDYEIVTADEDGQSYYDMYSKAYDEIHAREVRFSITEPVERVKDLIAVHNLKPDDIRNTFELGGFPMPSIAVTKDNMGHDMYGDITLMFHSDTIDPEQDRNNQVFGGDAWTPTFPTIRYKHNEKVTDKIRDLYYDNANRIGYDAMRPLYDVAVTPEDAINRYGGEQGIKEHFMEDTSLMRTFLKIKGKDVEDVVTRTETTLSDTEQKLRQHMIDSLGEDAIHEWEGKDVPNGSEKGIYRRQWVENHIDEIKDAYKSFMRSGTFHFSEEEVDNVISNMKLIEFVKLMRNAANFLNDGATTVKEEVDRKATNKLVKEAAEKNGYETWVSNLLDGIEEKQGIRNDKDAFTRQGNRRSWESLHEPVTLENVVKVMRTELAAGGTGILGSNPKGAAQKQYKSLDEIRSDEDRLQKLSEEEYKAQSEVAVGKMSETCLAIANHNPGRFSNGFGAALDVGSYIAEILNSTRKRDAIQRKLKNDYLLDVTDEQMDDLMGAIDAIANLPTGYFEAKPRRAVGFDEVKAAIIPSSTDEDIKQGFNERGIQMYEYDPEVEGDRTQKVNDAASENDLRFSISANLDEPYMDAVNSGNMEEAQEYVDQAAKRAGYTTRAYHGTTTNFNVFSRARWGENHDGYMEFGAGFYFTPSESEAKRWAERGRSGLAGDADAKVMSVYLNADRVINADDPIPGGSKVLQTLGLGEADAAFIANRTYRFINYLIEDKGFDNVEVQDELKYLGYDAVDATYGFGKKGQFVVFNPEQIKSADPVTYAEDGSVIPLSERFDPNNNDIRYSLPTQDSDGNILTDGQMEYFKYSQARDADGKMQVVYHTTNKGGFTVFDPQYSDDRRSLFFASNWNVSQTYGRNADRQFGFDENAKFETWQDFDTFARQTFGLSESDSLAREFDINIRDENGRIPYSFGNSNDAIFKSWLNFAEKNDPKAKGYNISMSNPYNGQQIQAKSLKSLLRKLEGIMLTHGQTKGYYAAYLNLENPLIVDAQNQSWNNIPYGEYSEDAVLAVKNLTVQDMGDGIYVNIWGDRKVNGEWQEFRESTTIAIEYITVDGEYEIPEKVWDEVYDFLVKQGLSSDYAYEHSDAFFDFNGLDTFDKDGRKVESDVRRYRTRELAEIAESNGNDGVIIRNCYDIGAASHLKGEGISDIYIAFSPEQVKDTRNENPSENPDIRYSKVDPDEAMSRAAHDYAYDTSHEMLLYYEDIISNLQDKDAASAYKKAQKFAEKDVDKFYAGLQWYSDGIKFDDAVLEEGRERMASSKADFFASNEARWNERWLTEGRVLEARSVRSPIRKLVMSVMQNSDTNSKYKTDLVNKTIVDARMAYYYAKQGRTDIADAMLWHSALRMIEDVDFIDDTVFKSYKDLRDYLRTTNISLNEEYWADIDYQAFRKRNYNKINLVSGDTNVDQIYQEMCELWPEWFKEDEEMTPPDQLARIEQVLDAIQPYRIAYSSEEAAEMAFDIASDLTRIIREDGKEYKSIADRYKEKYDQKTKALKERHKEALREANEKQKELEKKAKAQFKEYKAEQREKKYHDKYFDSIQKTHKELTKRLLTNTKDKHIPEQYKRELANLLAAFDFQTVRSKKLEMKEGADGYVRKDVSSKKTIQMRMLQGTLRGIENSTQMFRLNDSITDIMDNLLGTELGTYSEAMNVEGKTIDELNSDQLKKIDKMLKALLHEFNSYEDVRVGKKKEKAAKIGAAQIESSLAHAAKYGVGKDYHNFMGALDRIINMDELTPAYLFRQVDAEGDGIGIMFGELRKSFDRYVRNQAQLNEWIGEIVGKYHEKGILWNKYGSGELTKWRSANYQKEFMLENGKSVKLTPAQMMSIHCLAKRTQAYNHMTGAGIVVKPVAFEAKLISDLKQKGEWALPRKLTDNDIRMIENELTPEQIDVADKLQELMATKMAEWGNEASMNVLGVRLFEDKDYFPIKSDKSALEKDFDPQQFNEMIKNFGFTKAVAPGARNAIAIDDIFDVVSEHCNNMNLYNAYTEALNDFTKVYNYHQLGPDDSDYSVEQAIAHAYSQKATTFIRTFIQDLNGNVSRGRASGLTDVMNDMLGKAKKASVFANGRVALQQPTALVRAFAVMDMKYLKGFKAPTKENLQEMFDHCPIALWKSWGYYDINMGKSVEDLMMNNGSWAEDKMSDIYGKLDNATWCAIWNMCKAEVEDKHPDVKKGTDEYWELCNERMTEVVDLTQVVDSPFHRSHAMRDKGILQKMSTAFMAEPTLTYNMVRDGVKRMREAYVSGNKAEAAKIIGRTMSVFVAQAAAVAGAAAIWDAVRGKKPDKDDEDDKFFHLWWANAVENFKDNLKLWNNIYYVKDVSSLFDGWNISNLGLQGFVHLRDAWFQLTGKKKVQSSLTWYENAFAGAGYLTGMPFKTIMNDSKAIMGIFGLDLTALSLLDDEFTRFQSAVQDLMGGEAAANGFTKTSSDGGSKTTDDRREAKAEDKSEGNGLPTAVRGWTYDDAPFHVEDGSLADKFLNHFGVNLTAAEISAIEEAEAEKKLKAKIDDIKAKTESLSGEEKDKKVWSYVQSYMKAENGDKSWSELVAEGDYASIGSIEAMYVRAGGNSEYFDGRIMAESKSALKKSISSDNTPEQIQAQAQIRDYLLNNGMEPAEVSEIAYKSYTARDLKVAFRINDKEAMLTELRALVQAGLTEEDYQKLWDNRNRLDIKKYKESGGKYADRLKSTGVYNWPINGSITSRFGHRSSPGGVGSTNHQGLDIAGSMGDPVGASDGGTVVYAGWYGGAGKTVMIEHDDGTVTQYSHLSWYDAQPGDIVAQGQYIGKVGSTGNSTGPHLHFGVKVNGVYQDPETYLANR